MVIKKRIDILFIISLMLLLGMVSVVQAAPPGAEGGSTLGETLDLDNVDDTEPVTKNNLGTIMSGRKDGDTLGEDEDEEIPEEEPAGDDPQDEDTSEEDGTGTTPDDGTEPVQEHPVASAIADYFGVTYDEIMSLHEAGNGFGTITKAYFFAGKMDPPMSPMDLLDAAHGSGWGNVLKENGIHPGAVGNGNGNRPEQAGQPENAGPGNDGPPGQLKKGPTDTSSELVGQGGNNGNGRGNNGNGKGNNGNGNNGNNGQDNNGQGNGKGKNGK
jgi:hypothetical protein